MAGTVAKLVYPSNVNIGDPSYVTHTTLVGTMDEDDVLRHLTDQTFNKRADVLDFLRTSVRRNGGRLPVADPLRIFKGLGSALGDSNWDVRHQTIQLIHEMIPQFGDDLDRCMSVVLPKLIPNLGDSKITIRRAVIQTLHVYMKYTTDIQKIFRAIVQNGVENSEHRVRKEAIIALPMLFTPEFSNENFFEIAQALAKRMLDNQLGDESMHQHALLSLEKIRNLVGDHVFNSYLQRLSAPLRTYYYEQTDSRRKTSEDEVDNRINDSPKKSAFSFSYTGSPSPSRRTTPSHTDNYSYSRANDPVKQSTALLHYQPPESYKFGIVPYQIMDRLNDQGDFRSRAQAVEELKIIVMDLHDSAILMPHILQFVGFLNNLLDDSNFKITTVTLEILGLVVEKMHMSIKPHVKPLVLALTKRMGDNKIVVRQSVMKVVMQLMHTLSPKPVVHAISENLSHRNSRVRQETLNILIASLLTFPSYDFDLGPLCQTIAPTLVDPKRQVRQAALECFAVLAQAMGAGKLQPLVQAVDGVELGYDGEGVMAAVQARLARRQLPRLNPDNLVDYATPVPSSATSRGANSMPQGADVEWILAASGGSGNSARSARSEMMELESVTSSARSTPASFIGESPSQGPRRYVSANKKGRLPWDTTMDSTNDHNANGHAQPSGSGRNDSHPPLKPRTTWGGEEINRSLKPDNEGRRQKGLNRHSTFGSRDPSPDTGGSGVHIMVTGTNTPDHLRPKPPLPSTLTKARYHRAEVAEEGEAGFESLLQVTGPGGGPANLLEVPGSYRQIHMSKYKRPQENSSQPFSVHGNKDTDFSDSSNQTTPRGPPDAFSNSWPESSKIFDEANKSNKKKLDPINVTDSNLPSYVPDWASDQADERTTKEKSPIPTKPTLARGASSKRKVPPIPMSDRGSASSGGRDDDLLDSARDSGYDLEESQTEREMLNSLKQIRKSATMKKAEKIFEKLETSPSPPQSASDASESGIFSNVSEESRSKRGRQKAESPFQTKPRLVRNNSVRDVNGKPANDGSDANKNSVNHFNPIGGVTFRENHKSDVAIVGKGYIEDSHPVEPKPSPHAIKAKDRRRNKAVHEKETEPPPGVVGVAGVAAPRERRPSRTETEPRNLPRGVYGVAVKQNSTDKADMASPDDEVEEEELIISMSETTRKSMAARVQKKQEEAERDRLEKQIEREREQERERERERQEQERKKKEREQRRLLALQRDQEQEILREQERQLRALEAEEKKQREKERQQEKLRRLSSLANDLDTKNTTTSPPVQQKPPSSGPKRPESDANGEVLMPFKDPQQGLQETLRNMENENWETKMVGITSLRRLVEHHPDKVLANLHDVTLKLIAEVKNLRSQVSRLALVAFAELYNSLQRAMDADLEMTVKTLLTKNCDTNVFIRADVEKAVSAMVENVTPQRAMVALISSGASHKNVLIRKLTSQLLVRVVERMGPGRVLSGVKDVTDKILPTAAKFLLDGSPEVRHHASKILYTLMSHEDFDKAMAKHVPDGTLRTVQDKLDKIKKKGPSDPPNGVTSATARRSGQGSRSSSVTRQSSASSGINEPTSTPSTKRRTATVRANDAVMEEIKGICADMGASDWRERHKGITQFQEMTENSPEVIGSNIVKVFDKFIPCLKDSNSKVNLFALQTLHSLTPILKDYLSSVINLTIQTVGQNLSSKNKEIYDTAAAVLDSFMEELDGAMLLQPFANQAQSGNARIKPDMIERVAFLITLVYPRKPKQVVLHTLPLLWHLLGTVSGSGSGASGVKTATVNLVAALYSQMGSQLLDQANSNSNITPKNRALLEEMLDAP